MPSTKLLRLAFLQGPMLLVLLSAACAAPQPGHTILDLRNRSSRFEVPASLERERGSCEEDVLEALRDVSDFFLAAGFELAEARVIDSVTVFGNGRIVRSLAARYGMQVLVARASEPGFPEVLWSPQGTQHPKGGG